MKYVRVAKYCEILICLFWKGFCTLMGCFASDYREGTAFLISDLSLHKKIAFFNGFYIIYKKNHRKLLVLFFHHTYTFSSSMILGLQLVVGHIAAACAHVFYICDCLFLVHVLRMFQDVILWRVVLLTVGGSLSWCVLYLIISLLNSIASCLHPAVIKFEPCQNSTITLLFMIIPDGKWEYTTWHSAFLT